MVSLIKKFRWVVVFVFLQALFIQSLFAAPTTFSEGRLKCVVSVSANKVVGQDGLSDYKGGGYSSRSEVRRQEDLYRQRAQSEKGLDLARGSFDPKVLAEAYEASGARINWLHGTPEDLPDIFAALLIKNSKILAAEKKGKHFSKVYGTQTMRDFKRLREHMASIPADSFRLSEELLADANRVAARGTMKAVQVLGRFVVAISGKDSWLAKRMFLGGGNYRAARTRLYSMGGEGLSKEQLAGIENKYEELVEVGALPRVSKEQESLWRIRSEHPYLEWMPVHPFGWGRATRENKTVEGNFDIVWSYPDPAIIPQGVRHLVEFVNREMDKIDSNAADARDPIELAAIAQQTLVYLHAFKDVNGRTTKAIKNKILEKYGLPPDVRYDDTLGHDLDTPLREFVGRVRYGVYYAVNRMAAIVPESPPSAMDAKLGIDSSSFDVRKLPSQLKKLISVKANPKHWNKDFRVGSNRQAYVTFRGTFFQDSTGVLYVYRVADKTLYPLGDWSTTLYGQGGELWIKDTGLNKYIFRKPNKSFQEAIDANIELFSKLANGEVKGTDIQVASYEGIRSSQLRNKAYGEFFFQELQRDLLKDALEQPLDPQKYPVAILAPGRGNEVSPAKRSGPTQLQQHFTNNKPERISAGDVMSAYTLRRSYLIKLEQDLRSSNPELYAEVKDLIRQNRENIYIAARELLGNRIDLLREIFEVSPGKSKHAYLSGEEGKQRHKEARANKVWQVMYSVAREHEWYYPTFAEGLRKVDQTSVIVARNIANSLFVKAFGILTEAQQGLFVKMVPGLAELIRKVDAEVKLANKESRRVEPERISGIVSRWFARNYASYYDKQGNAKEGRDREKVREIRAALDKIVNGVLVEYYANRGFDAQFERPFVSFDLHLRGAHPQVYKSTTVDPTYNAFLNGQDQLKFFPGGFLNLYKVKINSEAVDAQFSPYTAQAEVLENTWMGPIKRLFRLKKKATEDQLRLSDKGDFGTWTQQVWLEPMGLPESYQLIPVGTPVFNSRLEQQNP